ncbi:isoleucine--tRNA ligase [Rathayibacter toxicus]|uniref:Isoleucine--tRNA ligase n=1 Tax=Rathayibacter toxicus TaxID=145458 RepID=A0A0U1PR97_9MICO|nr:isoleucine--tRNA ligase [Rathayibacter toxicus]KKM44552.1 isoleucine--tRNA ligase [Rathayibacter toxicus]PPG21737.1 isoleucine--tRNA ligase [Rathayibacter toxicus]PPG46699.1 isoleucine--tRNA ligase [Rathayibacter toxicus]PPH23770.1 isoleucine--tRNA ligase [Rathayibacter toxicus]PPH57579.1 isoleucine--tRNA ligase [Rathayibacter toxicus]
MTYPLTPSPSGAFGNGVSPSPRFPDVEKRVLAYWRADDTFQESIRAREGCPEWVFYDGPPFANGLPHYGHLLTGYAKDVFPRFETMRGKQVHRRFGWDTHGLPAELEAERQLGITDKSDIEQMGIAAFNAAAQESVLRYTAQWQDYVTRQARWVDFDNDYKTLDPSFMESVIWAFKQLYDKGLAYEGYRVLPYCWRDQTPLSNHELRMDDDVYRMRQDQTVTVTFPLVGEAAEALGLTAVRALAWTTTPWTLPTNAALAVGPDIEYAIVPAGPNGAADGKGAPEQRELSAEYLLAIDQVGAYAKDLGYPDAESALAAVSRTCRGRELEGISYDRLWDHYADAEAWGMQNAWQILVAEYVTTSEGTGIVHQAPAYGEDDQRVCEAAGIPVILSVDDGGRFVPQIAEVAGMHVFEANKPLTQLLRAQHRLLRQASYEHSYPHCWRCRNPLIYRAVSSWFVRVTAIRDRMEELNQEITWVPANVKDGQFGKWLAGARDWSISRNRYFGSPIPVWNSDDPAYPRVDVYGSLDELERDFGVRPENLHRPYIDELTRPNPDDPTGRSTMRRITDVLDVWFDSGSMPFAQVHYPFENADWFDTHNPADFIVEYMGQTRGWFYTLHVLSTALFDRPAFRNVVSHGIVLGNDGQKMSKSLRNYPDVAEVFDRDGSDAMRWFLMSSPVLRGGNLVVTQEGIREGVRQVLLPLWNTWYFFSLYANASGDVGYRATRRTDSEDVLDRYLLAKTHDLIANVTAHLQSLDATSAAVSLREFSDLLTNWYVRRSRDRFWRGVDVDGHGSEAFDTLFTVLEAVCRVAAPLLPLVTEEIWRGLTGGRSVHLTEWPDTSEFPVDEGLVRAMDAVRTISSTALSLRKQAGLRVRLPLARLTVVVVDVAELVPFEAILRDELNVKAVRLVPLVDSSAADYAVTSRLTINARSAGPRLGKKVQAVIAAAKAGEWSEKEGVITAGGVELTAGEYELTLEVAEAGTGGQAIALLPGGGFVLLDTATTPELEAEGLARDLIRAVQDARKAAGLEVSDRIELDVVLDELSAAAVTPHASWIAEETLATSCTLSPLTTALVGGEGAVAFGPAGTAIIQLEKVEADVSSGLGPRAEITT